jgi:hypothetical protein
VDDPGTVLRTRPTELRVSRGLLAASLPVAAAAAVSSLFAALAADLRWAAALGAYVVRHGSIPDFVPYAAAPSRGWHDAPVFGQVVLHALDSIGGDRALMVAQVVAVAAGFALLRLDISRAGASVTGANIALLLLIPAAFVAIVIVRAVFFALVLFPLLLLVLREEARRPSRRIWLVPLVLAVWANLHGTVLVGAAVAAAYLLLDRMPRDPRVGIAALALSAVALFATPVGWNSGDYYAGVLGNEAARRHVGQWATFSFRAPFDVVFLVCALVLVPLALRGLRRRWELVALVGLAVLVARSSRGEMWFAFMLATPAAVGVVRSSRTRGVALPLMLAVLLGLAVLGLARGPTETGAGSALVRQAVAEAKGTPILAEDQFGEQVALRGGRIWIGNPLDAFRRTDQRLYLDWSEGHRAGDAALQHAPRVVIVRRRSKAQKRLAHDPRFRAALRDANAVLYLRARA